MTDIGSQTKALMWVCGGPLSDLGRVRCIMAARCGEVPLATRWSSK